MAAGSRAEAMLRTTKATVSPCLLQMDETEGSAGNYIACSKMHQDK